MLYKSGGNETFENRNNQSHKKVRNSKF